MDIFLLFNMKTKAIIKQKPSKYLNGYETPTATIHNEK